MTRAPTSAVARTREPLARWIGLAVAVLLVLLAVVLPPVFGWDVHVAEVPPLFASWRPHVGPGTVPALAIAALLVTVGPRVAARAPWRVLLLASCLTAFAWIVGLATSEGLFGIARVLDWRSEYLPSARAVTDIGETVRGFIGRIPIDAPGNWPVNVAGHPPLALLFFVLLVRVGLGTGLAAGLVVIALGATIPAAVLIALRRLGAEAAARRAAPVLAAGPTAVWLGVSGDALAATAGAWGICCLAVAATASRRSARIGVAVVAGGLLGCTVLLAYGTPLLGLVALAVLLAAGTWRPLPIAAGLALAVVLGFAAAGFAWWAAYPVLVERYWAGVARLRPLGYWIWADLAILALSAGPVVGPVIGTAVGRVLGRRVEPGDRAVVLVSLAACAILLLADLSGLSKAEVERIWLPFVPWLLTGSALLPARWRRFGLAAGLVTGLAVEHLLHTVW